MKKVCIMLVIATFPIFCLSQNIGIGISKPYAGAMLDINSSNKGILIPRLSSPSQITFPIAGLIFYNTSTNQFNYYNGSAWVAIANGSSGSWTINADNISNINSGNVGIGTSTPKTTFNVADNKTVLFGADTFGFGNKLILLS